jgi:hypothetical protein
MRYRQIAAMQRGTTQRLVGVRASIALIDFQGLTGWRKTLCLGPEGTAVTTKVLAIPRSNHVAHFFLAHEMLEGLRPLPAGKVVLNALGDS